MSNKREPLLSDDEIERYAMMYTIPSRYEASRALKYAKGIYEAARAKDAELIQQMVDALHSFDPSGLFETSEVPLAAAKAAGFKPSDR
jgi:hypothetical protein